MAKYVCDTGEVSTIGSNVSKTAETMATELKSYSSNIDNDLSGWNSPAKGAFTNVNQTQIVKSQAEAEYAQKLGEFIQKAAEAIESLENELAGQIQI